MCKRSDADLNAPNSGDSAGFAITGDVDKLRSDYIGRPNFEEVVSGRCWTCTISVTDPEIGRLSLVSRPRRCLCDQILLFVLGFSWGVVVWVYVLLGDLSYHERCRCIYHLRACL